jgi:hypothetical protein
MTVVRRRPCRRAGTRRPSTDTVAERSRAWRMRIVKTRRLVHARREDEEGDVDSGASTASD